MAGSRLIVLAAIGAALAVGVYLVSQSAGARESEELWDKKVAHHFATQPSSGNVALVLLGRVYKLVAARALRDGKQIDDELLNVFGNSDASMSGSVGNDLKAIKEVIFNNGVEPGNLRERLTLLYIALTAKRAGSVVPPLSTILAHELSLYRTNSTSYTKWLRKSKLQFNIRGVNRTDHTEVTSGLRDAVEVDASYNGRKCYFPHFAPAKGAVRLCRCQPSDRACRVRAPAPTELEFTVTDIISPPMSMRELRFQFPGLDASMTSAIVHQTSYGRRKIQWRSGDSWWDAPLSSKNKVFDDAKRLLMPYRAGPSGTTDQLLRLARYFGLGEKAYMLMLRNAAIAWMVPTNDHSVHEILIAGRPFGLKYRPKKLRTAVAERDLAATISIMNGKKPKKNTNNLRVRRAGRSAVRPSSSGRKAKVTRKSRSRPPPPNSAKKAANKPPKKTAKATKAKAAKNGKKAPKKKGTKKTAKKAAKKTDAAPAAATAAAAASDAGTPASTPTPAAK